MKRYRPAPAATGLPGEVVWAKVSHPLEAPTDAGKARPVILVRRHHSRWLVMGLTTKSQRVDGSPRTAVPTPETIGLSGSGWLWGNGLTGISVFDVGPHIGWIDAATAAVVIRTAQLAPGDAAALVESLLEDPAA